MDKKRKIQKVLSSSVLAAILLLPTAALASSYTSTFDVYSSSGFTGPTRYYNGQDISIKTYNKSTSGSGTSTTFSIALYRDGWLNDYIGTVSHSRTSDSTSTFSNVGSGDYFFKFWKNDDGVRVWGDVKMWNSK
jgi:hypothetical protein